MAAHPPLTVRDLRVRPVHVPLRIPLQTSSGIGWDEDGVQRCLVP